MKYKFKKVFILILLIFILFEFIVDFELIVKSVNFSFNLCFKNLFPSLYPMIILSSLLIEYDLNVITSFILKPIMNKIFRINKICGQVLVLSMLSGSPSNAKYINLLYNKNLITKEEATKTLFFTHFVNPIFILSTVGIIFLNNKKLGIIILISHYLGNFIVGFLFRNYNKNFKNTNYCITNNKSNNFIFTLTNIIYDTTNTLFIIIGIITCSIIFSKIFLNVINLNNIFGDILCGLIEMTQGLKYISTYNINELTKVIIYTFLISFGGFSIHMQVMSVLNKIKIRYLPYFCARITHGIISSIIVFILYTKVC